MRQRAEILSREHAGTVRLLARNPMSVALGAVGAVGLAVAVILAEITRRTWVAEREALETRSLPGARAIVVFGAAVHEGGPCPELQARLDHAIQLYRAGAAELIIPSGGVAHGIDEVETMTAYLVEAGVPAEAILPGRPGHNTRATVATLREMDLDPYLAVSSPYHMHRIRAEARRTGVPLGVSAPCSPDMTRPRVHRVRFATEVAGAAWYCLPVPLTARIGPGRLRHLIPQRLAGQTLPECSGGHPRDPDPRRSTGGRTTPRQEGGRVERL